MRYLLIALTAISASLWGQTSGITVPEVTQFEPIDTTDLVNKTTGDFNYSIPAVVVPGAPGGSYPIALSYHAGILYQQEASWTGLGWNLSPGSISRILRGYPDDWRGASIERTERFKSVYSYSFGLGYGGASVGVQYNNHDGFSGFTVGYTYGVVSVSAGTNGVGVGLSIPTDSGLSVNIGYHSKGGFNGGLGYTTDQGSSVNVSYSEGTGVGFGAGMRSGDTRIGIDSEGGLSFTQYHQGTNGATSRSFSGHAISTTTRSGGMTTSTSGFGLTIPIYGFTISFGSHKTTFVRRQYSTAYGYLNLPSVRNNNANPIHVSGNNSQLNGDALYRDNLDTTRPRNQYENHTALDIYVQDYQQMYTQSFDEDEREEYEKAGSFNADYVSGNYDVFNVAAQGLSGVAKAIQAKQGWYKPSDSGYRVSFDDEWRVHSYRTLMWALKSNSSYWAQYHQMFNGTPSDPWNESEAGWQAATNDPASGNTNMRFLDDPGLVQEANPFPVGAYTGRDYFAEQSRFHNTAKKIFYELGGAGIERIVVVNPNGMRYIFGRQQVGYGVNGAAPEILNEKSFAKVTKRENGSGTQMKSTTVKNTEYAYAWLLAAVESPDYLDKGEPGYDTSDYGDYITFQYAQISGNYKFKAPWSDPDQEQFMLTGKQNNPNQYYFERMEGTKQVMALSRAVTKTHVAVFDLGRGADARQDAYSADFVGLGSFGNPRLDQAVAPAMYNQILAQLGVVPPTNGYERVFAFPYGTAMRMASGVSAIPFQFFDCEESDGRTRITRYGQMTYRGSLNGLGYDIFVSNIDVPLFTACLDGEGNPGGYSPNLILQNGFSGFDTSNRFANLKAVRLYNRDVYDQVVGFGLIIQPQAIDGDSNYLTKVVMGYDHSLAPGTPNSLAANKGRLTLKSLDFYARGNVKSSPGYRFAYYNDSTIQYDQFYRRDPWGFFSRVSSETYSRPDASLITAGGDTFPVQALWSLKSITTPVGTEIGVSYDADRYSWVQDRLAVDFDTTTASGQVLWDSNSDSAWQANLLAFIESTNPNYATTIQNLFAPIPLSSPANPSGFSSTFVTMESTYVREVLVNGESAFRTERAHHQVGVNRVGQDLRLIDSEGLRIAMDWLHDAQGQLINSVRVRFFPIAVPDTPTVWLTSAQIQAGMDRGECEKANFAAFRNWLVARCTYQPFSLGANDWKEQLIVRVQFPTREMDNSFVVPLIPSGLNYCLDTNSSAFEDLANWIYWNYQLEAFFSSCIPDTVTVSTSTIPKDPITQGPASAFDSSGGRAGVLGGGLRVQKLRLSESGGGDHYDVVFYYSDPATWQNGQPGTGLDSGAIFADPGLAVSGYPSGDKRILRSENHPYLNFPSAQVVYEFVTTKVIGQGQPTGWSTTQYVNAHNPLIYDPFNTGQGVERLDAQMTGDPQFSLASGVASEFKVDNYQLKARDYNYAMYFRLKRDERMLVMNNTALIGQPLRVTEFDDFVSETGTWRPVMEKAFEYQPNFVPNGDNQPTLAFAPQLRTFELNNNQIRDVNSPQGAQYPQGVLFEKSQAILLGLDAVSPDPGDRGVLYFNAGLLSIDEAFNAFRNDTVRETSFFYAGETAVPDQRLQKTNRNLAYDYRTGSPVLSEAQFLDQGATAQNVYRYTLTVPGHALFQQGPNKSMADKNMLFQEGGTFQFQSNAALNPGSGSLVSSLSGLPVLAGQISRWRLRGSDATGASWMNDATFQYIPPDSSHIGTDWKELPVSMRPYFAEGQPGALPTLDVSLSGGGRWLAGGMVSRYSDQLETLEKRQLNDVFQAYRYTDGESLVVLDASDAQDAQIYYQSFEGAAGNIHNTQFLEGRNANYPANFNQVYSGTGAYQGNYSFSASIQNRYSGVVDPRNQVWLSFFVKGTSSVTVVGSDGQTVSVSLSAPSASSSKIVQPAHWGWNLVRVLLNRPSGAQNTMQIQVGNGFIDDVLVYPAASGTPGSVDYRPAALVNLYAYHPHNRQMISMTNASGGTTRYEFDARGQLFRVYDVKGYLKSEHYRSHYGESFNP
ncbi:MAG: hypothetical protein KDC71_19800 [Acidobacteria bacterium]|nr:hypothetical protein [Acidobacteriota bacterium]